VIPLEVRKMEWQNADGCTGEIDSLEKGWILVQPWKAKNQENGKADEEQKKNSITGRREMMGSGGRREFGVHRQR